MNMNEYQKQAMTFAKFASLDYPFAGLTEETGEVLGKLAKAQRKHRMSQDGVLVSVELNMHEWSQELKEALKKELGDCLWMLAACADNIGLTLDDIAQSNINKLADRDSRGVIIGSGDNR